MNLSLTQTIVRTNTNHLVCNIAKPVLALLFLVCWMLNTNPISAQTNNCPEDDSLQWYWVQEFISYEFHRCRVGEIRQFEYNGSIYIETISPETVDGKVCPIDYGSRYYDCNGEFVCDLGIIDPDKCEEEILTAANNATTLWTYKDCGTDPLEWDWIQDLIATSDGNNISAIHQFQRDGNTYIKTVNSDSSTGKYYTYFDCDGEQICEYVFESNSHNCDDQYLHYNSDINFTIVWSFEDPYPTGTCPEGEDPLQWDWIQAVIATPDVCRRGIINQFNYNGNPYFYIGDGPYCGIADFARYYYNCEGDTVCVSAMSGTNCDNNFNNAVRNSTTIWTYEYPIAKSCPGYPEQWDWVQEMKENINGCGETEVIDIVWDDFTIIHFWNECDTLKNRFYDCEGKLICGEESDLYVGWLCGDMTEIMQGYTPTVCPEGDDPLQWDWMRDLIIEYSDCEVRLIHQFEYRGKTYFKTISGLSTPCDEFGLGYFDCSGRFICDDLFGENCAPDMVAAAETYEHIWHFHDGIPPVSCPNDDPLQLDWIQELIALDDECFAGKIWQFDYDGDTYFGVGQGLYCNVADLPTAYYYNCEGDTLCMTGAWIGSTCDEVFPGDKQNSMTIWTSEPPITSTCPEGDPEQWEWVQEMKDNINGCGETEIIDITWEDFTIIHFWNACDSLKDQFYDCQGNLVCGEGLDVPVRFSDVCNFFTDIMQEYTPQNTACPEGDPLQWDWMQDLIALGDECNIGVIDEFNYQGDNYYQVGEGPYCLFDHHETYYYNCKGEQVCDVSWAGNTCERDFSIAASNSTRVWTYELPIAQTCPEGDPSQWDWVQEMLNNTNECGKTEVIDIVWRELTLIHLWSECDSLKNRFYDCQGNLICGDGSDLALNSPSFNRVCDDLTVYVNDYTDGGHPIAIVCAENNPSQFEWLYELIDSSNGFNIASIRLFEYEGDHYFHTVNGYVLPEQNNVYYNCAGEQICTFAYGENPDQCAEEMVSASADFETFWTYDPSQTATCPEGDPLQLDWIQDLIAGGSQCSVGAIHQFEFEGNTYFKTASGCPGIPGRYFNCEGEEVCVFPYAGYVYNFCNNEIASAASDFTLLWLYEDRFPNETCPPGDPLEWDWMQDLIAVGDECNIGTIRQFNYDGGTYYAVSESEFCTSSDSPSNVLSCKGEFICANVFGFTSMPCGEVFTEPVSNVSTLWTFEPLNNGTYTFEEVIKCPESNTTSICAPVAIPPSLTLQEFSTMDVPNYLNSLTMQMEEQTDIQKYFTTTTRMYTIADEDGNQKTCETKHHIANQFLQMPEVSDPGSICEEDIWSYVKIGADQYKIYADHNGSKGDVMSTCNTPVLICSTADFGVDTKVPDTYNFWASTYFEFPDGSICESEAIPFYVDIQAKPVAELSMQNKKLDVGEGVALMDMVMTNQSGYWSGENIVYLMTATGENIAYFLANTAGIYKLYYTVRNDFCERSYSLIVKVASAGKAALSNSSYKTKNTSFNMYPNPTSKNVFIDIPDEAVYQISLTNISGKVVKLLETKMDENIIQMSVSDLPKGMYLVELKNASNQMLQKLIIE